MEYHIAGPADDEDYAQAEYLAEMLMVSLPSISCKLHPVLPDDWPDYVRERAGFLGCKQRAPLVWMSSGVVVGGLSEFTAECDSKYGLSVRGVEYSTWRRVAAENLAAAEHRANGTVQPPIGASAARGVDAGVAVCDALLLGNARYCAGDTSTVGSDGAKLAVHAATVLALTPLPAPAPALLGCDATSLFVVPCTPVGLEELAVGNVEHGVMALHSRVVVLLAAPTPELGALVQAARELPRARDAPMPAAQATVFERMRPALSRTLAVAPSTCSAAELERLCLEEWVRECADELERQSVVLAQLIARGAVHVERAVCGSDGALAVV